MHRIKGTELPGLLIEEVLYVFKQIELFQLWLPASPVRHSGPCGSEKCEFVRVCALCPSCAVPALRLGTNLTNTNIGQDIFQINQIHDNPGFP